MYLNSSTLSENSSQVKLELNSSLRQIIVAFLDCIPFDENFSTFQFDIITYFIHKKSYISISAGGLVVFMGDDFLRLILCRHIFSACVLRAHRSFRGRAGFHPTCHPALPELDILENPTLQRYALDLAAQLDVRHLFVDCGEVD